MKIGPCAGIFIQAPVELWVMCTPIGIGDCTESPGQERIRDWSHPCRAVTCALCLVQWPQDNAESLQAMGQCLRVLVFTRHALRGADCFA